MAKRRVVISEYDNIAAILEDDKAVEFIIHRGDMLLGDVYLATVENILPSIDAAFVNVGGDKMGFLHSSDVPGKGDLKDRLEPKQQLVVQVMKEPTGHKGPRVTTNISLPGRFLVMMPESKGISISRKIQETAERSRLKSIVSLVKPAGVGVIIRTESAGQKESDLQEDFETLLERWQNIVAMADTATPPTLLYRDQDLLYRVIRESVTEDVQEIMVDSAFGQQRAQQLLQNWNMDKGVKVTQYQGSQPILVGTGVDREIKQALQTKVPLPSGGYLYIQPTEALTVVDVNSGKFTSLQSQAETIKLTNLEACREIARQLRLRNIGGMIIVDFIDMESRADQLTVLETFENELAPDKAKPQMGQLSDLGLVEMTRHRQGQSLSEIFTKRCPHCSGTGHAMDELAWVQHAEGERSGRQPGGRSKLPVRYPRQQQVPRVNQNLKQRQQGGRVPLEQLAKAGARREEEASPLPEPGTLLQKTPTKAEENGAGDLMEAISHKTYKEMGAKLSSVAKLSYLPSGTNSILSRINPKANDIVTLVHSIEAAASMPTTEERWKPYGDRGRRDTEDRDEDLDEDEGETEEESSEAEHPEAEPALVGARSGRNKAGRDEDTAEEPEAAEEPRPRRGARPRRAETEAAIKDDEDNAAEEDEDALQQELPVGLATAEEEDDESGETDEDAEESSDSAGTAASRGAVKRRRGRPPKRRKSPGNK